MLCFASGLTEINEENGRVDQAANQKNAGGLKTVIIQILATGKENTAAAIGRFQVRLSSPVSVNHS